MFKLAKPLYGLLVAMYWIAGLIVYFGTASVFFSEGENFLGFLMLFFPPAGVVLPWFAAPWLGVVSVVGIATLVVAAAIDGK